MQQKELATLLDISPTMVSRLAKRGMPTDTLERAERWRKRHLEPGRVKGSRAGTTKTTPRPPSQAASPGQSVAVPTLLKTTGADFGCTVGDGRQNLIQAHEGGEGDSDADEGHDEARTRLRISEANLSEMKEAEERGSLIRVDAVKAALGTAMATMREALLQIPSRIAPLLAVESNPASIQATLHEEIYQTLTHLVGASERLGAKQSNAE